MPGSMSDFLELELLDHVLRNEAYTAPTTVFVALYTVAPSDSGGGTEVSGNGYARQSAAFLVAAAGATSNSAIVSFTASGGNWGTIVAFSLFSLVTAGDLLFWADLTTNRVVNDGDTAEFAIGDLDITLD